MAYIYVNSADGNNADNGSTWALAKATAVGAGGVDAAGDVICFASGHSETTAGAVAPAWAGTAGAPTWLLNVNSSAAPPTALGSSLTYIRTTSGAITILGSGIYGYVYGLTFESNSSSGTDILSAGYGTFDACRFHINDTTTTNTVDLANGASAVAEVYDCLFLFAASGHGISCTGQQTIKKSSLVSGTSPTALFNGLVARSRTRLEGFDASNGGSSMNICSSTGNNISFYWENGKLPASWSGELHSGTPGEGSVFEMVNVDSGDTTYRYRKHERYGTVRDESTLVMTGGSDIDGVGISYKMVSGSAAEFPHQVLNSPRLIGEVTSTGSSKTATVEILFDSATALKDNEVWLELQYQGTSGYPLSLFVDDAAADVLATAADQTSSSVTWTTTGLTNPNKRSLSVTFTPQEKGAIFGVVKLAKASTTIYVNPEITVT